MDYRVIKEDDLFLLTDNKGNIPVDHPYGLGLYTKDTRFLSRFNVLINGEEPILLASDAAENYMAKILLTNPHMETEEELVLWRESVEIERTRFISNNVLYETLKLKNYFPKPVTFDLTIEMDVDFKDMFIIRGFQTGKVGSRTGQEIGENSLAFGYKGSDCLARKTAVGWDRKATSVTEAGQVTFRFTLGHAEEDKVTLFIQPQIGDEKKGEPQPASTALAKLHDSYKKWSDETTKVKTDHAPLQSLIDRGIDDLRVLLTDVGYGPFPVAGLPWFGVPFGRDSIIAALQMLAFNPQIAKGTILTMANYQGKELDPWRDEQPGKIMHEIRYGELANTGQIPFTPYYGTIDATPLFLILVKEYVNWTGDFDILSVIEANIESALKWIDFYGDRDGDMFVEYHQESSKGIANQGWKDSGDSIVHRNGDYAESPIALSEVQGYVYQAKIGIADLYDLIGKKDQAEELRLSAEKMRAKFNDAFWMEDKEYYAIALDADKNQVGTITSNPGHLLYSGMLSNERAEAVSNMLVSEKMFSGYGIRTMGEGEAGYNPMSYHDGSIWPHDNSLILLGLSKTGRQSKANTVIGGLIKAASYFEYNRLPELFCGYGDSLGKAVKYPVACSPQAWAAGTPLVFVQTILGLFPDCSKKEIHLSPRLLAEMNELAVHNVRIGEGILSVHAVRTEGVLEVKILENTTGYKVVQQ
ncbi:amylo-alpha-1,6-glucosidase [Bacillus sp. B-jedd]|uniref:amylo-alpha-1,6-glucosidase n=1 Tax=Bacillus sp. B-jedd TaxID=1476857 RepID=UPI00051564C0|nr:amylo-alpha-1,6-glucosidase [Bacillus sp. B-jedd]CEG25755.1 putative amylo-alpha-1,6-glucosidase [Bacillus sp. B-jedd]